MESPQVDPATDGREITGQSPDEVLVKVDPGFVNRAESERLAKKALLHRIEDDFRYHSPRTGQSESYTEIRHEARSIAETMISRCPTGRELDSALTHLETAVMFANAAIARHG